MAYGCNTGVCYRDKAAYLRAQKQARQMRPKETKYTPGISPPSLHPIALNQITPAQPKRQQQTRMQSVRPKRVKNKKEAQLEQAVKPLSKPPTRPIGAPAGQEVGGAIYQDNRNDPSKGSGPVVPEYDQRHEALVRATRERINAEDVRFGNKISYPEVNAPTRPNTFEEFISKPAGTFSGGSMPLPQRPTPLTRPQLPAGGRPDPRLQGFKRGGLSSGRDLSQGPPAPLSLRDIAPPPQVLPQRPPSISSYRGGFRGGKAMEQFYQQAMVQLGPNAPLDQIEELAKRLAQGR
jgi:hypothetical protein